MAWIRLLKSTEIFGKKLPIARVVNVSRAKQKELTESKSAEDYNGDFPPKNKIKTDFFKPKNIE